MICFVYFLHYKQLPVLLADIKMSQAGLQKCT